MRYKTIVSYLVCVKMSKFTLLNRLLKSVFTDQRHTGALKLTPITTGMTNKIWKVETGEEQPMILRVYGSAQIDREFETKLMTSLSKRGLSPRILSKNSKGRLEEMTKS